MIIRKCTVLYVNLVDIHSFQKGGTLSYVEYGRTSQVLYGRLSTLDWGVSDVVTSSNAS